jgi:hypothetical protein
MPKVRFLCLSFHQYYFARVCSFIPRSDQPASDVPHRKDDAVDVVQRHQWLGLAVRDVTASWSVLLEPWATLRALRGWDIFMCSGTIGGCSSDFCGLEWTI